MFTGFLFTDKEGEGGAIQIIMGREEREKEKEKNKMLC